MKKLLNIRSLVGLACIVYALVLLYKPTKNTIDFNILELNKPSESVLCIVDPIAKLVTDNTDRAKLAVFNQEFAKRVISYQADSQQVNDVYVASAICFFQDTIDDKYEGLSDGLINLLKLVTLGENVRLTDVKKSELSEYFLGLSWALTQ